MKKDINEKISERLRLSQLIACKRMGVITEIEDKELTEMIEKENYLRELYTQLMQQMETQDSIKQNSLTDKEVNHYWKKFNEKYPTVTAGHHPTRKYKSYLMYIGAVAATIAAIVCSIYFLINPLQSETNTNINPSRHSNYLSTNVHPLYYPIVYGLNHLNTTTENCQVIYPPLNIKNKNLLISKTTTQSGNSIDFMTSDSSVIALNQCSSLRYPTDFDKQKREVWLDGEAFFHIKHKNKRKFLVHVDDITISVLGTEFNVQAYPNAPTKVTLISGSINIKTPNEEMLIQPGETATYLDGKLSLSEENNKEIIAWTENRFYFNYRTMKELSTILSKWYGVNLKCQDSKTEEEIVFLDTNRQFSFFYASQQIEALNKDHIICFKPTNKNDVIVYTTDRESYFKPTIRN